MSTLLKDLKEKKNPAGVSRPGDSGRGGQARCGLCGGELYPGDLYFLLEGQRICEACLERYARRCFAHRRRRLAGREGERA